MMDEKNSKQKYYRGLKNARKSKEPEVKIKERMKEKQTKENKNELVKK